MIPIIARARVRGGVIGGEGLGKSGMQGLASPRGTSSITSEQGDCYLIFSLYLFDVGFASFADSATGSVHAKVCVTGTHPTIKMHGL